MLQLSHRGRHLPVSANYHVLLMRTLSGRRSAANMGRSSGVRLVTRRIGLHRTLQSATNWRASCSNEQSRSLTPCGNRSSNKLPDTSSNAGHRCILGKATTHYLLPLMAEQCKDVRQPVRFKWFVRMTPMRLSCGTTGGAGQDSGFCSEVEAKGSAAADGRQSGPLHTCATPRKHAVATTATAASCHVSPPCVCHMVRSVAAVRACRARSARCLVRSIRTCARHRFEPY